MNIRFANEQDAAGLLAVYGQYIDTSITFETELPTPEAFAARIRDIRQVYPYLALEDGGRIAGYAYAHRIRERAAYDWSAELSVYLARDYTGRGYGRRLYGLLMDLLALQNVKTAIGCVTVPNPASEALHEAMGFTRIGVSPRAGYKNGAWHDVAWFEKPLGPYEADPAPLLALRDVDPAAVDRVLASYI